MNALVTPSLGGETPAQQIVRIRSLLETPRQRLQFIVNADTIIDSGSQGRDSKNGPLPEPVIINQIGGEATFLISYRITTWIVECPSLGLVPAYQSHRWREIARIDENAYTTKIRTGKIYTRSDINANADALRGLIVPPIDNGFKITSMEFTLQEDGLAMSYSWEEREVFLQPPAPSTKAEGEYIESTASPYGEIRHAQCRVKLTGAKTTDQGAMLTQAIIICLNTVSPTGQLATNANDQNPMLMSAAIKKSLYTNEVEVNFKVLLKTKKPRAKGVAMDLGNFALVPKGSEPGTPPPDPGTRGTAQIQLFANLLQLPCAPAQQIQLGSQGGQPRALSTSSLPEVRVLTTKVIQDDQAALYSTTLDSLPGFYTHCRMNTDYPVKTYNKQLAIASPNSASVVVTLASSMGQKIVEGSVEKAGSAPKIPDPNVSDSNLVLLHATISPDPLELSDGSGDGTMMTFRRKFRYVYAILDVTQAVIDGGMPPFLDPQVRTLSVVQPGDLIHGLIDGGGTSTLSTGPFTIPGGTVIH